MKISASALQSIQLLSVFRKHLDIAQLSFSLFFIGHHTSSRVTRRTKAVLITASDQTVRDVHSCNNWFVSFHLKEKYPFVSCK